MNGRFIASHDNAYYKLECSAGVVFVYEYNLDGTLRWIHDMGDQTEAQVADDILSFGNSSSSYEYVADPID